MLDEMDAKSRKERVDKPLGFIKVLMAQAAEGKFTADSAHVIQAERELAQAKVELERDGRTATGQRATA